jgi:hypothetical protein
VPDAVVNEAMLQPIFAMAALTAVVWVRMFLMRLGQMKRERIHPQAVATSAQVVAKLTDSRAADNFRNLFELPVLFYAAAMVAMLMNVVTPVSLGLAWAFVLLRVAHSLIQCTYNRVMHRFWAYALGGVALWSLWLYLALYSLL